MLVDCRPQGIIPQLYREEWDFPVQECTRQTVMIATVPRSGSTFFCSRLWSTWKCGAPLEYLNLDQRRGRFSLLDHSSSLYSYWNLLKKYRTSPNGVFSYKCFMSDLYKIAMEHPNFLASLNPDSVIFLTRSDKENQAKSYARAIATNQWFYDAPTACNAPVRFSEVTACLKSIIAQEKFWLETFNRNCISPLEITYEEILKNEKYQFLRISEYLNISDFFAGSINIPTPIRQRAYS